MPIILRLFSDTYYSQIIPGIICQSLLLDPCMLLFLPVARLTPARPLKYQCSVARLTTERLKGLISALCLPVAKLTAARPHQCPMPPCCKASCLDPIMVWSGLCFIPLASAAHPTRGPNALERRGLWSGLVCVLYTTPRSHSWRII